MKPNEGQFEDAHAKTMGHLDNAIRLTRGLANIYSNNSMTSSQKEAAVNALNASMGGSGTARSTEHEYHEAMSQDPRYDAPEDLEGMGNNMASGENLN
jgi:hypothetical protein